MLTKKLVERKKISFSIDAPYASKVMLVGDFNNWDHKANLFTKEKNAITIELEVGKEYQFRYCIGAVWLNESEADKHVLNPFGDSENSIVVL